MRQVVTILLMMLLGHVTSGQQYPDCNFNCQRSDLVPILQPPLSYTTMRSDEFNTGSEVTLPTNGGCNTSTNGIINCGVGTTLMDCDRGSINSLDFTDLSDYFVWNRTATTSDRTVSIVFRFNQSVNIGKISLWFWNSPQGSLIDIPSITLFSSNDDTTTPSNPVTIDTSNTAYPKENRRYRQNVDIISGGLMIQSLEVMMRITGEGRYIFLNEVLFCVSPTTSTYTIIATTTTTTTITITTTTVIAAASITSNVLDTHSTTTGIAVSTSATSSSISVSSSSSSSNIGIIVGVILAVISVTIVIIIIVIILVVWKRKRSESTKPEGVYYSAIGKGTLQTSLSNKQQKPEPIYTEVSDKQSNSKNISITNQTQESVTMQDNPAYSNPKEQVVLQDNPAYSSAVNEHVKLQDNPA